MKNIVAIGGGTGTFTILNALKDGPVHLAAIISMADDGGSTGLLRDQYGVLPPGDVRRALVALSESSQTMRDLFNYRFHSGDLKGHSFGNIFISVLEKVTGSFSSAVEEASNILKIKGAVVPVTLDDIRLHARLNNGKMVHGETNIDIPKTRERSPIKEVWLEPKARLNPRARTILREADIVVIGPGDIYTSLIPNLLVTGMKEELKRSKAKKIYFCNLMTKKGETDHFDGNDFAREMEKYLGKDVLDYAVFNNRRPSPAVIKRYRAQGAEYIEPPKAKRNGATRYLFAPLIDSEPLLRHGPPKRLAKLLLSL
jgi:uncharacterized cofD-like protein